jgi:glyoxylase-like metal-dependent hydrolase (beta-lactamase superfamily II)
MTHRRSLSWLAVLVSASVAIAARRGPATDPLIRENGPVRIGDHTYVIPGETVSLVPNVGDRATLVIDPGLGRRNGERVLREVAKVSGNAEPYVASTHFHPEHTTGYVACPPEARSAFTEAP